MTLYRTDPSLYRAKLCQDLQFYFDIFGFITFKLSSLAGRFPRLLSLRSFNLFDTRFRTWRSLNCSLEGGSGLVIILPISLEGLQFTFDATRTPTEK